MGYLAVTLLVADNPDYVRLIVNTIRKDLEDPSEMNCCLALAAVTNICSKDMANLASDVYRLLSTYIYYLSQNIHLDSTSASIRKKASLCLLCLFKRFPESFSVADWASNISLALQDYHLVRSF